MNKFIKWSPRVLSILFILFLTIFSFDVFTEGSSFGEMVLGFLMHNIPTIVLTVVLILSWKRPELGGFVFILSGLLYIWVMRNSEDEWYLSVLGSLILAVPAFITGGLFLVDWKLNERE